MDPPFVKGIHEPHPYHHAPASYGFFRVSWEEKLGNWTAPASTTEDEKRDRTVDQIRSAINKNTALAEKSLVIKPKGSYANNTNVRLDSDVDVNVEYTGGFFYGGLSKDELVVAGEISGGGSSYQFSQLKDDTLKALVSEFGSKVTRGNKALTIPSGSTTLPADVVPCFSYRYYFRNADKSISYRVGTAFKADDGKLVINYPQQHYDNGVAKNKRNRMRYKSTVRIWKRLENEMVDARLLSNVPSYLIECLVYNCPDSDFMGAKWLDTMRSTIVTVYNGTKGDEPNDGRWVEANGIKYLFHKDQKWDRPQAHNLALQAWKHLGLK